MEKRNNFIFKKLKNTNIIIVFRFFFFFLQQETITPNIRPLWRWFPDFENRAHAVYYYFHQVDHHLRCAQGFLLPRLPLGACPQRRQGGIRGNGNVE